MIQSKYNTNRKIHTHTQNQPTNQPRKKARKEGNKKCLWTGWKSGKEETR